MKNFRPSQIPIFSPKPRSLFPQHRNSISICKLSTRLWWFFSFHLNFPVLFVAWKFWFIFINFVFARKTDENEDFLHCWTFHHIIRNCREKFIYFSAFSTEITLSLTFIWHRSFEKVLVLAFWKSLAQIIIRHHFENNEILSLVFLVFIIVLLHDIVGKQTFVDEICLKKHIKNQKFLKPEFQSHALPSLTTALPDVRLWLLGWLFLEIDQSIDQSINNLSSTVYWLCLQRRARAFLEREEERRRRHCPLTIRQREL